jgi:multiple sugar transport system ATP-binding protein
MTTITFDGVTKVYRDGTVAVDDLDLTVQDGELLVLLGASGSGKTTILRLVAGLEKPTEGRILLDGDDITHVPVPKRNVAMVFQHLALYPHLSVYENIAFGVRAHHLKKPEVDRRVRRTASLLGLQDVLAKRPGALSGGQAQRVALGRAIVREPRAFLMDEPLSSLEERLRLELRNHLARTQRELGITTLYVTHDQSEALALGDRVGVLRDGVLEQVRTPKELYERPENLFVAGFVGSPPMNLAAATLDRAEDGGLTLLFGGHRLRVDPETVSARPRLGDYMRRQVVIGIRPEHLRPVNAASVPDDARLRAAVVRNETLGGEAYVQFAIDAPLVLSGDVRGNDTVVGAEGADGNRLNLWLAKAQGRAESGGSVEVSMVPGRLHVFDPATGEPVER